MNGNAHQKEENMVIPFVDRTANILNFFSFIFFSFPHLAVSTTVLGVCLHFFFSRETFFSAFQWKANARLYACRSVCLNSSRIGIAATTIKAGAIRLGIYVCR